MTTKVKWGLAMTVPARDAYTLHWTVLTTCAGQGASWAALWHAQNAQKTNHAADYAVSLLHTSEAAPVSAA